MDSSGRSIVSLSDGVLVACLFRMDRGGVMGGGIVVGAIGCDGVNRDAGGVSGGAGGGNGGGASGGLVKLGKAEECGDVISASSTSIHEPP